LIVLFLGGIGDRLRNVVVVAATVKKVTECAGDGSQSWSQQMPKEKCIEQRRELGIAYLLIAGARRG
jgi:hypothetical protein